MKNDTTIMERHSVSWIAVIGNIGFIITCKNAMHSDIKPRQPASLLLALHVIKKLSRACGTFQYWWRHWMPPVACACDTGCWCTHGMSEWSAHFVDEKSGHKQKSRHFGACFSLCKKIFCPEIWKTKQKLSFFWVIWVHFKKLSFWNNWVIFQKFS